MATWIYRASSARATGEATFDLATNSNIIVRNVLGKKGQVVANVGNINPGDRIYLVYAGDRENRILKAIIDEPTNPHPSAPAVDVISGTAANHLAEYGYELLANGTLEVIRLTATVEFVTEINPPFRGQSTIQRLTDQIVIELLGEQSAQAEDPESLLEHQPKETSRSNTLETDRSEDVDDSTGYIANNVVGNSLAFADRSASRFDRYIMIDWSSCSTPVQGKDSVWFADLRRNGDCEDCNFPTRDACITYLIDQLRASATVGERVLVGFDFAFGYPKGFVNALRLADWRALTAHFHANVQDTPNNAHNRDDFARSLNQSLGRSPGPFWGVHRRAECERLTSCRVGRFEFPFHVNGECLKEFRCTELATKRQRVTPQSVWKLNQGVSVGGQAIMGIGRLHQLLAEVPSLTVWPQLTGWGLPEASSLIVVEIFPSLVHYHHIMARADLGPMYRDRAQVRACCEHACELDRLGQLADYFDQPSNLEGGDSEYIAREEGWILWSNVIDE
jgi:hypothetical protein